MITKLLYFNLKSTVIQSFGAQCYKIEPTYIKEDINDFSIIFKNKTNYMLLGPLAYINHSCKPNAKFKCKSKNFICVETISPIEAQNEIVINYGENYFDANNVNCKCDGCIKKNKHNDCINNNVLIY